MIKGRVMSSLDSPLNEIPADGRHHVQSMLMRESLLDKQVMSSTETPVVRMLPFAHVLKVGGRSIMDKARKATYPLVDALPAALATSTPSITLSAPPPPPTFPPH